MKVSESARREIQKALWGAVATPHACTLTVETAREAGFPPDAPRICDTCLDYANALSDQLIKRLEGLEAGE